MGSNANVSKEAAVMTDKAQLYKTHLGDSPATTAWTTAKAKMLSAAKASG